MASLLQRTATAWRRDKPLALLAIVALAIGIGSATAISTVIQAVLLNPLPYTQSDRWTALFGGSTDNPDGMTGLSQTDLFAYRDQTHSFDAFGIYLLASDFNLTAPGQPRHIEGIQVSPSLIPAIGIPLSPAAYSPPPTTSTWPSSRSASLHRLDLPSSAAPSPSAVIPTRSSERCPHGFACRSSASTAATLITTSGFRFHHRKTRPLPTTTNITPRTHA